MSDNNEDGTSNIPTSNVLYRDVLSLIIRREIENGEIRFNRSPAWRSGDALDEARQNDAYFSQLAEEAETFVQGIRKIYKKKQINKRINK